MQSILKQNLMKMKQELLDKFVGSDPYREWMSVPFYVGDYVYATDAHTAIRLHADEPKTDENLKNHAITLSKYFERKRESAITIGIDRLKEAIDEIPKVNAKEEISKDCSECHGTGKVEWEYGNNTMEAYCPICDGEGVIVKEESTDKLIPNSEYSVIIFNRHYRVYILEKLLFVAGKLNDYQFKVYKTKGLFDIFELDGVEIILMPMPKDSMDCSITI